MPGVSVIVSDEPEKARMAVKGGMALYIGGMGARDKNFYNDLAKRLGLRGGGRARSRISSCPARRWRPRRRCPTRWSTPCTWSDRRRSIRDRLQAWKEAGRKGWVHTMQIGTPQPEALELLAEELL